MKERHSIYIIGGASGVGKTSLLKLFTSIKQINTGDLFKLSLSLENRDEIKRGDWSVLEGSVTAKIISIASDAIQNNQDLIIDTHFAAKIYNKQYRIGLKEEYLHQFGKSIIKLSMDANQRILFKIILITTNPYLLLMRRRLDDSRTRELIPSDCYNDLRCNDVYIYRYISALRRAEKVLGVNKNQCCIECHIVKNEEFALAKTQLTSIIRR